MKEPLSTMSLEGVTGSARDNFDKLNRLFQGFFVRRSGSLGLAMSGFGLDTKTLPVTYERISRTVTLQWPTVTTASKIGTGVVTANLPDFLWPAVDVYFRYEYQTGGGGALASYLSVSRTGLMTFQGSWAGTDTVELLGTAVHYLGL